LHGSWFEPRDAPVESAVASSPMPSVLMYGSLLGFLLVNAAEKGVAEMQLVEPAQVFTRKVRDVLLDNFSKEKANKLLAEVKLSIKDPLQLTVADVPDKHDVLMIGLSSNHDFFSSAVIDQISKVRIEREEASLCFDFILLRPRSIFSDLVIRLCHVEFKCLVVCWNGMKTQLRKVST